MRNQDSSTFISRVGLAKKRRRPCATLISCTTLFIVRQLEFDLTVHVAFPVAVAHSEVEILRV